MSATPPPVPAAEPDKIAQASTEDWCERFPDDGHSWSYTSHAGTPRIGTQKCTTCGYLSVAPVRDQITNLVDEVKQLRENGRRLAHSAARLRQQRNEAREALAAAVRAGKSTSDRLHSDLAAERDGWANTRKLLHEAITERDDYRRMWIEAASKADRAERERYRQLAGAVERVDAKLRDTAVAHFGKGAYGDMIEIAHDLRLAATAPQTAPAEDKIDKVRCPSCDHEADMHQPDGCWYTVEHGVGNLVCACSVPRQPVPAADPAVVRVPDGPDESLLMLATDVDDLTERLQAALTEIDAARAALATAERDRDALRAEVELIAAEHDAAHPDYLDLALRTRLAQTAIIDRPALAGSTPDTGSTP